ncbi:unnamed protein product [Ambrosiozyma monospora]|uniref:Unnamed protein product n=1 Tax=Ambrosiozyma monospora TaxID=43982 RepID=A0ACB5U424_AMBMO|nr:unnamed protein product [Ambrosiozyma monospora]
MEEENKEENKATVERVTKNYDNYLKKSHDIFTKFIQLYGTSRYTEDEDIQKLVSRAKCSLGIVKLKEGQFEEASSLFEKAKAAATEQGDLQLAMDVDSQTEKLEDMKAAQNPSELSKTSIPIN